MMTRRLCTLMSTMALITAHVLAPVLAPALAPALAHAQGASQAAVFLTLPSSARGLALGDGWGTVVDGGDALFFNPAQLARVRGADVSASLQRYVMGTTLGAASVATPLGRGVVAFGVRFVDYGSTDEVVVSSNATPEQGVQTGAQVSAQDVALSLGYGLEFGEATRWRVGAALTWAQQHVAAVSGSAVAADVGVALTTAAGWDFSAALQNAGPRLTLGAVTAPLPLTWRVGAALPAVRTTRATLRPIVEVRQVRGDDVTGVLAAEGTWRASAQAPLLAARIGYALRSATNDRSPLSLGGGLSLGRLTVDYAYEGFELLGGATHRVGLRFAAAPPVR